MKTCPACTAENNADSKFCSACGGVLVPGPEATVDHNPPNNASIPRPFPTPIRAIMAGSCREPKSLAAIASCPSPGPGRHGRGLSR